MSETLLKLRCSMEQVRELITTAPSPGSVAGVLVALASGLVGVFVETKDTGDDVAFIYKAAKIVVPKYAATGATIALGAKVYYGSGNKVYGSSATGRRYCGIALAAAEATDTEVEIELDGVLGITAQSS